MKITPGTQFWVKLNDFYWPCITAEATLMNQLYQIQPIQSNDLCTLPVHFYHKEHIFIITVSLYHLIHSTNELSDSIDRVQLITFDEFDLHFQTQSDPTLQQAIVKAKLDFDSSKSTLIFKLIQGLTKCNQLTNSPIKNIKIKQPLLKKHMSSYHKVLNTNTKVGITTERDTKANSNTDIAKQASSIFTKKDLKNISTYLHIIKKSNINAYEFIGSSLKKVHITDRKKAKDAQTKLCSTHKIPPDTEANIDGISNTPNNRESNVNMCLLDTCLNHITMTKHQSFKFNKKVAKNIEHSQVLDYELNIEPDVTKVREPQSSIQQLFKPCLCPSMEYVSILCTTLVTSCDINSVGVTDTCFISNFIHKFNTYVKKYAELNKNKKLNLSDLITNYMEDIHFYLVPLDESGNSTQYWMETITGELSLSMRLGVGILPSSHYSNVPTNNDLDHFLTISDSININDTNKFIEEILNNSPIHQTYKNAIEEASYDVKLRYNYQNNFDVKPLKTMLAINVTESLLFIKEIATRLLIYHDINPIKYKKLENVLKNMILKLSVRFVGAGRDLYLPPVNPTGSNRLSSVNSCTNPLTYYLWNGNLALCCIRKRSITEMIQHIIDINEIYSQSKNTSGLRKDVITTYRKIKMKCPLTLQLLSIPVTSILCEHDQPIELSTLLTHCLQSCVWYCPLCKHPISRLQDIQIHQSLLNFIKTTPNLDQVEYVLIDEFNVCTPHYLSKGKHMRDSQSIVDIE